MKIATTYRMMFFIITACCLFSCKNTSAVNGTDTMDSTTVRGTERDNVNSTLPDTVTPSTTDTIKNRTTP